MTSGTIVKVGENIREPLGVSLRRWRRTTRTARVTILIFSAVVLALLLLAPLAVSVYALSADSLIFPMSVVLTILFAVEVWSWHRMSRSLFDPYILFAVAAMLFNGSAAILETLGLAPSDLLGIQFSAQTALTTLYLVALALWSYHIGGVFGVSHRLPIDAIRREEGIASRTRLRALGWVLIGIAIVPTFILLRQAVIVVLSSGYFAIFQLHPPTSFNALPLIVAPFLIPGVLLVTVASKDRRWQLGMSAALISIYALTELFIGSRQVAIPLIVAYVWVWHRSIKPLSKFPIVIGVLLLTIVLPLVRASRSLVGEDRLSPSKIIQSFSSIDNPLVSILSEMGGTATTIAYTVDLVPSSRPYDYGKSYELSLLALIPNLFWDVDPAVAQEPAKWLIRTVDPATAKLGGGLGYSFIAEGYLNAGWAGVIVVSGILGFFFAKLTSSFARTGDLAKIACTAAILAFSLYYTRGDSQAIVRGIFWYALGPYALAWFIARKPVRAIKVLRKVQTKDSIPQQCASDADAAI